MLSAVFFYFFFFFFFNDTATTEIYTLSLHDALPNWCEIAMSIDFVGARRGELDQRHTRSEEYTSELQSRSDLVCRLLLEKKKKKKNFNQANKKKIKKYKTYSKKISH